MSDPVNDVETQEQFDAFVRRLKIVLGVALLAVVLPIAAYTFFIDHRIEDMRETLSYRPPAEANDGGPDDTTHARPSLAGTLRRPVRGQLLYVPVYSHVYHQDGKPHLLTITLSVRNTSPETPVVVGSVQYFDTQGKPQKSYLKRPMRLGPLATGEFLVEKGDSTGGSGANFLVEWTAEEPVSPPVVEAVMIDTSSQQGISFVRTAVVVRETAQ